jgi:hypothetical protein
MIAHAVAAAIAHPDFQESDDECPNTTIDLGLVHLAAPIPDVAPLPWAREGAPAAVDASCNGVGFGIHTDGADETAGQKRTGTEKVRSLAATSIEVVDVTGIADSGDSGGPLLCGGVVVGATSCHDDGDWPDHKVEHYARVDLGASWIAGQLSAWGSATP